MPKTAIRGAAGLAALMLTLGLVLAYPATSPTHAAGLAYPRLGVVYYDTPWKDVAGLARYDLWIGANDYTARDALKALNPNLKLIAYQISTETCSDSLIRRNAATMAPGFADVWWLRSNTGSQYHFWQGCPMVNQSAAAPPVNGIRFNRFFANFVRDYVWAPAGGKYDGIYYDNAWEIIAWKSNDYGRSIDLDRDGVNDLTTPGEAWVDQQWGDGYRQLMQYTREFVGTSSIIMGGSSRSFQHANGRMWEDWPIGWDPVYSPTYGFNSWRAAFENYREWHRTHYGDLYYLILTYPKFGGDYSGVRYGLASTLMGDGYFSSGQGYGDHTNLWWYDEFSVDYATGRATGDASQKGYLGYPKGGPVEVSPGVWRRDFDNGIAIVNANDTGVTVDLGNAYRKLLGSQDPAVNNGQTVSSVGLGAADGIILLNTGAAVTQPPAATVAPPPATPTAPSPAPETATPAGSGATPGPAPTGTSATPVPPTPASQAPIAATPTPRPPAMPLPYQVGLPALGS